MIQTLVTHNTLSTRQRNSFSRYRAIQDLFHKLYNIDRLRLDDVYAEIYKVYYIQQKRVDEILKMRLPNI